MNPMRTFYNIIIIFFCVCLMSNYAYSQVQTDVQKDYGNEYYHGLKYINDKAIEIIEAYNKKHNTHWMSLEPDLRIFVDRCLVPLEAQWAEYDPYEKLMNIPPVNPDNWYVSVTCNETVSDIPEMKTWDIYVPTTRPKEPSQIE